VYSWSSSPAAVQSTRARRWFGECISRYNSNWSAESLGSLGFRFTMAQSFEQTVLVWSLLVSSLTVWSNWEGCRTLNRPFSWHLDVMITTLIFMLSFLVRCLLHTVTYLTRLLDLPYYNLPGSCRIHQPNHFLSTNTLPLWNLDHLHHMASILLTDSWNISSRSH